MAKPQKKQSELAWAHKVMEVFENLGTEVYDQKWSTSNAKYLATWMREDAKNEDKFLTAMVPKATDILAKHGLVDAADAVLEIDAKTIRDLKILLVASVSDSQDIEVTGEPSHLPGYKPTAVEVEPDLPIEDLF